MTDTWDRLVMLAELMAFVTLWCVVAVGVDLLYCYLRGNRRKRK